MNKYHGVGYKIECPLILQHEVTYCYCFSQVPQNLPPISVSQAFDKCMLKLVLMFFFVLLCTEVMIGSPTFELLCYIFV